MVKGQKKVLSRSRSSQFDWANGELREYRFTSDDDEQARLELVSDALT